MYTESEFMDMSLSSRLDKLQNEITKLVDWTSVSHNLNKYLKYILYSQLSLFLISISFSLTFHLHLTWYQFVWRKLIASGNVVRFRNFAFGFLSEEWTIVLLIRERIFVGNS